MNVLNFTIEFSYFLSFSEAGGSDTNRENADSQQLLIKDENDLVAHVTHRLTLPMSQKMLDRNFKHAVVKRCWEDQLRIKSKLGNQTLSNFQHYSYINRTKFCL